MTTIERIKNDKRVESVGDERGTDDGFWVYLKAGFCAYGDPVHAVHESSPTKCLRELRCVQVCKCVDCSPRKEAA